MSRKEDLMLTPDELERLSRFAADELSEDERIALEALIRARPEMAQALKRLRRLDEVFAQAENEVSSEVSSHAIDAAVRRAAPAYERPKWRRFASLAAALILILG